MIEYSSTQQPSISIEQTVRIHIQPIRTIQIEDDSSKKDFYQNPFTHEHRFKSIDQERHEQDLKTIPIEDQRRSNDSTIKPILKKSEKKHRVPSISYGNDSSRRSLPWNSVQNELYQKLEDTSRIPLYPHRLLQSTLDILHPNASSSMYNEETHRSKLNVYVKPYRFEKENSHGSKKKERVSWSPTIKETSSNPSKKKKPLPLKKDLSNSSMNSYHSLIGEKDFKDFSSLIPSASLSENPSNLRSSIITDEEENSLLSEAKTDVNDQQIKHYEDLLEKMIETDEQLISRNALSSEKDEEDAKEQAEIEKKRFSSSMTNISKERSNEKKEYFSPLVLQMCFLLLILFNLFILYYYNDLSIWWNHYLLSSFPVDEHHFE